MSTAAADDRVRLFLQRQGGRLGDIGAGDEEECFTALGRRVGIWLSTEPPRGESTFQADVDLTGLEEFEVTADGSSERTFVVPAAVVTGLGFSPR